MAIANGLIRNVVVVMLENRSYDNVLGWLYNAGNQAPYDEAPAGQNDLDGLTGTESNVDPYTNAALAVHAAAANTIGGSGQTYPATTLPLIDPNETFGSMAQQYLGVAPGTGTPYEGYTTADGLMNGYLANYSTAPLMSETNIGDVMTYLTPAQLPVTAFLANQFAVCDQWFASVPSQTFVNRLFALCAAPQVIQGTPDYSVVDDADHSFSVFRLTPESNVEERASLLGQIDTAFRALPGPHWRLYFHDYSIAMLTMPYLNSAARSKNLCTFDNSDWGEGTPFQLSGPSPSTFVDDVQNGTLPHFSFIEPRYNSTSVPRSPNPLPPNSNHPAAGDYGTHIFTQEPLQVEPSDPPIDCSGGELLLMQVYNLLCTSSYWESTLLIVTYDEAGGLYDHVAPQATTAVPAVPAVQSPSADDTAAVSFGFNAYGGRVPAIIVSPYVAASSVIRSSKAVFDHTSIIKTVWDLFDLGENAIDSLTARDAAAASLEPALTSVPAASPGAFSGTLIASPTALILVSDRIDPQSLTLLASAGPGFSLSATGVSLTTYEDNGQNWVTVAASPITFAPDVTAWTIGLDTSAVRGFKSATLTGLVTITAVSSTTTLTQDVPITLYLS